MNEIYKIPTFFQKINFISTIAIELYSSITCSLLLIFIPQKCGNNICSIRENLSWNSNSNFYNATLIINFITLFSFCSLYLLEIIREKLLSKYLIVNIVIPNDNESVGKNLDSLRIDKKNKIIRIDKYYKKCCYVTIFIYLTNTMCSFIIINKYYINNQTIIIFITYILYMCSKLGNVYTIVNTDKNIFYSAYMKSNVQFNDIILE